MLHEIIQPLRFTYNVSDQILRQRSHSVRAFTRLSPSDRLLPFQIKRPTESSLITEIHLMQGDVSVHEIFSDIAESELDGYSYSDGTDRLVYRGNAEFLGAVTYEGEYHIRVVTGSGAYYDSEIFVMEKPYEAMNSCYTKIRYSSCTMNLDIASVHHFRNYFYLDCGLAVPTYEYEEEVKLDNAKKKTKISKNFTKLFSINTVVDQWTSDVINSLDMHDEKIITLPTGEVADIEEVFVDNEFDSVSLYNNIRMKFVVKNFHDSLSCKQPEEVNPTSEGSMTLIAEIIANEEEFVLGKHYCGDEAIDFVLGDNVLIFDDETQMTGCVYKCINPSASGWSRWELNLTDTANNFVRVECVDMYWLTVKCDMYRWHDKPVVTTLCPSISGKILKGVSFPNTTVHAYYIDDIPVTDLDNLIDGIGEETDPVFLNSGVLCQSTGSTLRKYYVKALNLYRDFGYSAP